MSICQNAQPLRERAVDDLDPSRVEISSAHPTKQAKHLSDHSFVISAGVPAVTVWPEPESVGDR